MRVLHVIHSLDPRSGGPVATLTELVRAQAAAGHDVQILTTHPNMHMPPEFPALDAARVVSLNGWRGGRAMNRFRYSGQAALWLKNRLAEADRPDIVHIHGLFSHVTISAARCARRLGVPYIMRPAGGLSDFCIAQGNRLGKRLLWALFVYQDMKGAAAIHATSEREARDVLALFPSAQVEIVRPPIPILSMIDLKHARHAFLDAFPQCREKEIVLFLSRLAPKKGPELLARAFAVIASEEQKAFLVYAGADEGMERPTRVVLQEAGLADRVLFTGHLNGALKTGALAAASLLALPSEDENFGVVVAEAMAAGTPVLTCSGVDSHILVEQADGGLTMGRDETSLGAGILALLRAGKTGLGGNGRQYIERHLAPAQIQAKLEALYARAIAR